MGTPHPTSRRRRLRLTRRGGGSGHLRLSRSWRPVPCARVPRRHLLRSRHRCPLSVQQPQQASAALITTLPIAHTARDRVKLRSVGVVFRSRQHAPASIPNGSPTTVSSPADQSPRPITPHPDGRQRSATSRHYSANSTAPPPPGDAGRTSGRDDLRPRTCASVASRPTALAPRVRQSSAGVCGAS